MNLSDICGGIQHRPPRILLHGPHGVGKSTFGASAPHPIFIQTEDGLINIDVPHFPLSQSFSDVISCLNVLINEQHQYQSLIIDTLDWLEKLIFASVCEMHKLKNIEDLAYGKGYMHALGLWDQLLAKLTDARNKGMAIILLAHTEIKTFSPPDGNPYDRYQIKLQRHAAARIEEWADMVLFATFKTFVANKKAVGSERILYTAPNPAWRAKNRYSLPESIGLNFQELYSYIKK